MHTTLVIGIQLACVSRRYPWCALQDTIICPYNRRPQHDATRQTSVWAREIAVGTLEIHERHPVPCEVWKMYDSLSGLVV